MKYYPNIREVKIADDVIFGENVTVIKPCNLYGCTIDNNCFIGPYTEIQKDVKIGKNSRIQSHSFICSKVDIGDNCFIGHGVMFINDTFSKLGRPAYVELDEWKSTTIGNNVTIGNNATILPVRICDYTIIGAGAIVTKDISQAGIYAGNPARLIREINR